MTQPDFDEFSHDPLGYARTEVAKYIRPTEEQERVARELRGLYVALTEAGFGHDDSITIVTNVFTNMVAES